jgi:heat shock 70kDa protein 1/2/6/8
LDYHLIRANSETDIKRLIERSFSKSSIQNGFKLVGSDIKVKPKIIVNGNGNEEELEPEEVVSLLFGQLKEIAENYLGAKVTNAVVTVPASFNAPQRKATKEAADMAGLSVVLLDEPIAALLAYGLEKEGKSEKRNVLVFDFGGGSLDVSVVTIQGKELKVKATIKDTDLGGEYFDDRLAKYCQSQLMLVANENPEALRRLRSVAEKAKLILSSADQSSSLYDEVGWEDSFTLVMLDRMNQYHFEPCIDLVVKCLMDAGVNRSEIEDVVIAGGLSNIPSVQELLCRFFKGKELCKSVQLDEVMVRGAAIQAAILSGQYSEKKSEEMETADTLNAEKSLKENSSTSLPSLVGGNVDDANKHTDKSFSSENNTGRYSVSKWIWMCSLAAVATVSFLFAPRACNLLREKQGMLKQWYDHCP